MWWLQQAGHLSKHGSPDAWTKAVDAAVAGQAVELGGQIDPGQASCPNAGRFSRIAPDSTGGRCPNVLAAG
jgi:hypothetical protein